jgi:rare lipoprotein A
MRSPRPFGAAPRLWTTALLLLFSACGGGTSHVRAQGGHLSSVPNPPSELPAAQKPIRVLRGLASYYSDRFAGRKTSNGEIYDPTLRTAASRDLPMGTVVRVIRRDTGAQVIVRINDRGPFNDKRRILDLSRAAAERLDMVGKGVVRVQAEVLTLGKTPRKKKRR